MLPSCLFFAVSPQFGHFSPHLQTPWPMWLVKEFAPQVRSQVLVVQGCHPSFAIHTCKHAHKNKDKRNYEHTRTHTHTSKATETTCSRETIFQSFADSTLLLRDRITGKNSSLHLGFSCLDRPGLCHQLYQCSRHTAGLHQKDAHPKSRLSFWSQMLPWFMVPKWFSMSCL